MHQPLRSTDSNGTGPAHVMLFPDDIARVPPNKVHCGYCAKSWPDTRQGAGDYRSHRCVDPAGRSYEPLKQAAARARLAREQLRNFPVDPCIFCGRKYHAGQSHTCSPTTTYNAPHSLEALDRANRIAAFKADMAELEKGV